MFEARPDVTGGFGLYQDGARVGSAKRDIFGRMEVRSAQTGGVITRAERGFNNNTLFRSGSGTLQGSAHAGAGGGSLFRSAGGSLLGSAQREVTGVNSFRSSSGLYQGGMRPRPGGGFMFG